MLRHLLKPVARRRSVLLCYHGVGPYDPVTDPSALRVPAERFRAQMRTLRDAGFELVSVQELLDRWGDAPQPPPGLAAISFDDGMRDNHAIALPILRELGGRATVYVLTGAIGGPNPFLHPSTGERMMTGEELLELVAEGWELGAHTVTHPDLREVDEQQRRRELRDSKAQLEALTGTPVRTFAYPFCRYTAADERAVVEAGFDAAVTCHGLGGRRRSALRREMVGSTTSAAGFLLKVLGAYQPLRDSGAGAALRRATRPARLLVRQAALRLPR